MVAIFIAKELHHILASLDFGVRDFGPGDTSVLDNPFVHEFLDIQHLLARQGGAVEIEGELFGPNVRTFLRCFFADHFVQSPVKEVSHGMMALNGSATALIHAHCDLAVCLRGVGSGQEMQKGISRFLRIDDVPGVTRATDFARVTHLSTHLSVKWGDIQNDGQFPLMTNNLENPGGGFQLIETNKARWSRRFDLSERDYFRLPGIATPFALLFHELFKTGGVDSNAPFPGHQLCEVEGESIGIVKLESKITRELLAPALSFFAK